MHTTQDISHDPTRNPSSSATLDSNLFDGLHVLLVDDNFLSREITKTILEETGFIVDTAEDGQEELYMLCAAEPYHYDFILSDVQMPIMNGHDAARAIRALDNPLLASIPIIALSADYYDEDVQAALDCGMNAHLAKPLDINTFTTTLTSIMTATHAHTPINQHYHDYASARMATE